MHSLALFIFRFHCKTFSKLLNLTLRKILFRGCILKDSYIQIKNLYGYKLLRAANRSELKRCSKYSTELITRSSVNYLCKRKSEYSRGLLETLSYVDSFIFRFDLCLIFSCLDFCILSHFEIIRYILKSVIATSTYFLLKYD